MTTVNSSIVFENVSKFYGEVLGVNRVNLTLPPGVTSLVGPNGSGKTTLMNLVTGLVRPTQGRVSVLGLTPDQPEEFFRHVGYCTQFDSFPQIYRTAAEHEVQIRRMNYRRDTLEDIFLKAMAATPQAQGSANGRL